MAKTKGSTKKNKGPKGKKARAKAKLDRQWGEVNIRQDDATTQRVGKSRLLAAGKRKERKQDGDKGGENRILRIHQDGPSHRISQDRRRRDAINNDSDDSSATSREGTDVDDLEGKWEENPMNELLTMIQESKSKKRTKDTRAETKNRNREGRDGDSEAVDPEDKKANVMDEDDDESSNEDSENDYDDNEAGNEEFDDEIDDEIDNLNDDASASDLNSSPTEDFFRRRFGRLPFPKSELDIPRDSSSTSEMKKIKITPSIELQISSPFGKSTEAEKLLDVRGSDHWQLAALGALSSSRVILQRQWKGLHRKWMKTSNTDTGMTDFLASIYAFLSMYSDSFVTMESNAEHGGRKGAKIMHQIYLLHLLNHVLTSRSRIARNNRLLKDAASRDDTEGSGERKNDTIDPEKVRDQGFTRPTVLVLLPTRGMCHIFVQDLLTLVGAEMDEEERGRFEADYGTIVSDNEPTAEEDPEKERRRKAVLKQKGKEWNELFGETANQDDDFKMGISLIPKAVKGKKQNTSKRSNVSVKLYSDFFKSDIIVASPLGLKMLIAPDDEENEGDFDYLSSIEICLLENADVMLMQNWDHVNDILALLNQEPRNNNSTDFSRVRNYMLEGQGAHWRQLIFSSKFMDPNIVSSFKRFGKSLSGSIRVRQKTPSEDASIANVILPIKQVFQKVPVASFAQQSIARVDFFLRNFLPKIQEHKQGHTMVFIPSYFDFCSLRNALLKRDDVSFVSVTEYSRTSEIGRGRARFLQGRKPLMLYTGRAHYFYRHAIRGVQHLIFLGVPEHPDFYPDHVNLIGNRTAANDDDDDLTLMLEGGRSGATSRSCVVLFTKYEAHALERVVGSTNCSRMVGNSKTTFMFHS